MSTLHIVLLLVAVERGLELVHAEHNTRALKAAGAVEVGARHYPLLVALHASWLLALLLFVPAAATPRWPWLAAFILLQLGRLWVLITLGRYWTTRIITLPQAPLVRRGPYRFVRHPNYLIVTAEIAVLPLAFGAWPVALAFSLANAAILAWRIEVEEGALAVRRSRE